MPLPRRAVSALAALVLLAACTSVTATARVQATAPAVPSTTVAASTSTSTSTSPQATSSTTVARGSTVPPTTPAGARLRWKPCDEPADYECATLAVPRDYADPGAGTFSIALNRRPANDRSARIGALVVNPGGPGGSGLSFAADLPAVLPDALLDRFDLVGFDPRGVGESDGIECTTDAQKDERVALDDRPDTRAEVDALVQSRLDDGTACIGTEQAKIPYLTTVATARDLERLREALGDEKLTFLGYSYGTHLGATYAQLFPAKVRAFVLDGVINPVTGGGTAGSSPELDESYGASFDRAFERFAAACAASPACPLGADAKAVRDKVAATVETAPLTMAGDRRKLTPGWFTQGVSTALYQSELWPALAVALQDAAAGDAALLFRLADIGWERDPDGHYGSLRDANHAIVCADQSARTPASAVTAAAAALTVPPELAALDKVLFDADCAGTPLGKEPFTPIGAAVGAPPILVVGTEGDPATDVANTTPMAKALGVGVTLFWEGDGHTAFTRGGSCIDDAVVAYLVDLTVPADGTRCPANPAGTADAPATGSAYTDADLVQQFAEQLTPVTGGDEKVAACIANGLREQLGPVAFLRLIFSTTEPPPAVVTAMQRLARRC